MIKRGKQNQTKKLPADNFLEIFKDGSLGKTPAPIEEGFFDKDQYLRHLFADRVQRSEHEIYNRKNQELKQETQALLGEIKNELAQLKKAGNSLQKQVEKAVEKPIAQPGPYHISFLEHIKTIIVSLRKKIEDSSSWLAAWNQRKQKRGFFWGTFLNQKKGGVQFLLSSEHYSSRSAG